ncbi:MAG: teichoic acid transporter [Slackia sp.]|nr:teichoic acid transporter [Slackia sp.]
MKFMKPSHKQDSIAPETVRYIDGSSLARPFDPPKSVIAACIIAAALAAVIGGMMASKTIDQVLHGEERAAATVESNIARDVSYDIPLVQDCMALDDASIMARFEEAGFIIYDLTGEGDSSIDLMKLPSDTNLVDAGIALGGGIGGMDAVAASKYLVGSWRFTADRTKGTSMRVRYADLKSANATEAIDAAMASQGWIDNAAVAVESEGQDEVGNTYREGTLASDTGAYTWRVSVCPLSDVYDIAGLPDTAQYVGIKIQA